MVITMENAEDIAELNTRIGERTTGYAEFVNSLKAEGIEKN